MATAMCVYCLSLCGVLTAGNVPYARDGKGLEQKVWQQEWRKALDRHSGVRTKFDIGTVTTAIFWDVTARSYIFVTPYGVTCQTTALSKCI